MVFLFDVKSKSNKDEIHEVAFDLSDGIRVKCSCMGHRFGTLCSHKMDLINNKKSVLVDVDQEIALQKLQDQLNESEFSIHLKDYISKMNDLVDMEKQVKLKIKTLKNEFYKYLT
jgi:hypothetical protein